MPQAPDHKRGVGAVPQAAQEEHQYQIEVGACLASAVAAQGDVEVVTEPTGQRHVPAAPELCDRLRRVGVLEVLEELEAKHASQADRHARVAREVEVDLDRVAEDTGPRELWRELLDGQREDGVASLRCKVGDQHLLAEANQEAAHT